MCVCALSFSDASNKDLRKARGELQSQRGLFIKSRRLLHTMSWHDILDKIVLWGGVLIFALVVIYITQKRVLGLTPGFIKNQVRFVVVSTFSSLSHLPARLVGLRASKDDSHVVQMPVHRTEHPLQSPDPVTVGPSPEQTALTAANGGESVEHSSTDSEEPLADSQDLGLESAGRVEMPVATDVPSDLTSEAQGVPEGGMPHFDGVSTDHIDEGGQESMLEESDSVSNSSNTGDNITETNVEAEGSMSLENGTDSIPADVLIGGWKSEEPVETSLLYGGSSEISDSGDLESEWETTQSASLDGDDVSQDVTLGQPGVDGPQKLGNNEENFGGKGQNGIYEVRHFVPFVENSAVLEETDDGSESAPSVDLENTDDDSESAPSIDQENTDENEIACHNAEDQGVKEHAAGVPPERHPHCEGSHCTQHATEDAAGKPPHMLDEAPQSSNTSDGESRKVTEETLQGNADMDEVVLDEMPGNVMEGRKQAEVETQSGDDKGEESGRDRVPDEATHKHEEL